MRIFEVFLKKPGKKPFEHAGSLEAPDAEMALLLARETYARRAEGELIWVVDRQHVHAADAEFVAPNADKPHRHSDGAVVAERRRRLREAGK